VRGPQGRTPRSALLSFRFLGTATVGTLMMALVTVLGDLPTQVAALGATVSVLGGLFAAYVEQEEDREARRTELLEQLRIPMDLAHDHRLFDVYRSFGGSLCDLSRRGDPVLRSFALLKLTSLAVEVQALARGTIAFHATEAWRTVYAELLGGASVSSYRSVAWVKTADYWQDAPGRASMQLNLNLARGGLPIERILIVRDELWPACEPTPPRLRGWIAEQHRHGIALSLVRESTLAAEPDLLADYGIYGERAVGIHELDERSRTVRFVLQFDEQGLKLAGDRWARTMLYATPFADPLDRPDVAA
jgi:hypothetical protein